MGASLSWTISESNVSVANNTSKVTVTLRITATGATWNGYSQSGWIKIDGTKYTFSHSFSQNSTTTLATKSKTVTHNSDGSKSCSISCSYNTGVSTGTLTKSTTKTLTKINRNYTVTLNPNSGTISGKSGNITKTKAYGTNLTLPTPARTNYTFKGWTTTAVTNATNWGTNYNTTYTANASDTLYAAWWSNYSIKYNGNENTGGSTATSNHIWNIAKNLTANGFTKTGYSFSGWATSVSGNKVYNDKQSVTRLSSSPGATVNLYAKWTINQYTIIFNLNGGTGTTPTAITGNYKTTIQLPSPSATKTGYTFAGWSTIQQEDNTIPQYSAGDNFEVLQNQTLYAVWISAAIPPSITIEATRLDSYGKLSTGGNTLQYKINWTPAKAYNETSGAIENVTTTVTATAKEINESNSQTLNTNGQTDEITNTFTHKQDIEITVTATPSGQTSVVKKIIVPYIDNSIPFKIINPQIISDEGDSSKIRVLFDWQGGYNGNEYEKIRYIHLFYKSSILNPDTGEFEESSTLSPWNAGSVDKDYGSLIYEESFEKEYDLPSTFEERELFISVFQTAPDEPITYNPSTTYYRIGETATGSLVVHIPADQRGISLFGIVKPEEKGLIVNKESTFNDSIKVNPIGSAGIILQKEQLDSLFYKATINNRSINFGIGNDGNAGIYSDILNKWLIYTDNNVNNNAIFIGDINNSILNLNSPNINIRGQNLATWVVERGTSKGWTYRKWSDNTFDAWGYFTILPSSLTQQGSIYYSNWISLDKPFPFHSGFLTGLSTGLNYWLGSVSINATNTSMQFRILRGATPATIGEVSLRLILHGTYV